MPDDLARFQSLYRQAHDALLKAAGKQGWGMPLLGAALALLMLFPLRIWLHHLCRRYAAS